MHLNFRVAAWVFDCDGVLLDTVKAKVAAFRAWVPEPYAHLRDEFNRYNLSAFGRSRRIQLQHFYENMVGQPPSEEFLAAEIARFARINREVVQAAPWLPGSREFVKKAAARRTPLHVLSGTPEAELRELLEFHGVAGLFASIIGSPASKPDGLRRIIAATSCSAPDVVFVGDATHDYESARAVGVRFLYKPSEASMVEEGKVHTVKSLLEISYD